MQDVYDKTHCENSYGDVSVTLARKEVHSIACTSLSLLDIVKGPRKEEHRKCNKTTQLSLSKVSGGVVAL